MEFAFGILDSVLGNEWVAYGTAVVTVFSAVAAVTPTPEDGTWRAKMYKAVDWLALNINKAKDRGDKAE